MFILHLTSSRMSFVFVIVTTIDRPISELKFFFLFLIISYLFCISLARWDINLVFCYKTGPNGFNIVNTVTIIVGELLLVNLVINCTSNVLNTVIFWHPIFEYVFPLVKCPVSHTARCTFCFLAHRGGSDGSMSASGSAGPGFNSRRGSKFSFEKIQPRS